MIRIEISDEEIITRQKADGSGEYYQQFAYAFLVDRNNKEEVYPRKIKLFAQKNDMGQPVAYKKGFYRLMPNSLRTNQYGDLELGFINLQPIKPAS